MAKIIYFGTEGNGKAGHYPMGIDKNLTHEECKIWTECDNETWINNIYKNPGRHLIKHHGVFIPTMPCRSLLMMKEVIHILKYFGRVYTQRRK